VGHVVNGLAAVATPGAATGAAAKNSSGVFNRAGAAVSALAASVVAQPSSLCDPTTDSSGLGH
jgi:hypothetical protein